jgi:23S rRNA pseudouridine1911/1915/1917 synthase
MAQIGHPVIGDGVYSNGKNEFEIEGQCLHARKLEFKHPITGKLMQLEAPLPLYFQTLLKQLEAYRIEENM